MIWDGIERRVTQRRDPLSDTGRMAVQEVNMLHLENALRRIEDLCAALKDSLDSHEERTNDAIKRLEQEVDYLRREEVVRRVRRLERFHWQTMAIVAVVTMVLGGSGIAAVRNLTEQWPHQHQYHNPQFYVPPERR